MSSFSSSSLLLLIVVIARRTAFFRARSAQFFKNAWVLLVHQHQLFKHLFESLFVDRFPCMIETAYSSSTNSSTTGLSTRPIAVAANPATKTYYERMTASVSPIPPSAERPQCNQNRQHPVWYQNTFPDDETTTMTITITMSIRHPLAQIVLFAHAKHGSILWEIARLLWENPSVVGCWVRQEESAGA